MTNDQSFRLSKMSPSSCLHWSLVLGHWSFHEIATFRRVWAVAMLLLIAVTWRVWLPQSDFPQVPLARAFGLLPTLIDFALLAITVASLICALVSKQRGCLVIFATSFVALIAIDQQRFQPWAYQGLVIAIVLASCSDLQANKLLRWFVISIYLWSAWSKCDFTFLHNLGQQFLQALVGLFGGSIETWPEGLRLGLVALFPLGEAAVGVSLCFRRAWPYAVWAALVLHLLLILILGPLGLKHSAGVLVWNVFFIVQNFLLFREPADASAQASGPLPALPLLVVIAAIAWPIVEPLSLCDHWPAWSVYAPRSERVHFYLRASDVERLPPELAAQVDAIADEAGWRRFRLDRWCLAELDVPLYPQNRVQVAVAEAVARRFSFSTVRLVCFKSANRWTGAREVKSFYGNFGLSQACDSYWVGAHSVRPLLPAEAPR